MNVAKLNLAGTNSDNVEDALLYVPYVNSLLTFGANKAQDAYKAWLIDEFKKNRLKEKQRKIN